MSSKMNETGPIVMVDKFTWFDPRINLGHILTMAMIVCVGYAGWLDIQKRITVLEDARQMQKQLYQARVLSVDTQMKNIVADARDLRNRVDQLSDQKGKK